MKLGIFLGSASVGGGTYVIFEHAVRAQKMGEEVTILTELPVKKEEYNWHPDAASLNWATIDEVQNTVFDVVISTWWRLVYEVYRVKGKHYIYFVQSIESKFYSEEEKPLRQLAEATYMLPMEIITEATWIKDYLKKNYLKDAVLVQNGIRKDIYTTQGKCYAKRIPGKLRVLIEGPIDVSFKNVPKAVELCCQSDADEIWLMTSSNITSYPGVDRVFSRVPIFDTPPIYRSCDVILKLSYVEGMSGPPLEMYHCGGTSITYDVTGHDEYIVHGENGLVVARNDDKKVIEYINKLKHERTYLEKLKENAIKTANKWPGWEDSSRQFYHAVLDLCKKPIDITLQDRIEIESKFHFQSYVIAEDYYNEVKRLNLIDIKKRLWYRYRHLVPQKIRNFGAWILVDVLGIKIDL